MPSAASHPDLIRPQKIQDEELADIHHFYTHMSTECARRWEDFKAGDQFPVGCTMIPEEFEEDFWGLNKVHTSAIPSTPTRRQNTQILPAISIRSRQIAADNFKVGANIIIDGEVFYFTLKFFNFQVSPPTGDDEESVDVELWVAKIFAIENRPEKPLEPILHIYYYHASNGKNPTYTLNEEKAYQVEVGTVLIDDFMFTKGNKMPKAIRRSAENISRQRPKPT